jgi:molybdate-binding protein
VALRLADALGVSIGHLFALDASTRRSTTRRDPTVVEEDITPGTSVHVCRVGEQWVGIPVSAAPYNLPVGDGVVASRASVSRAPRITMLESLHEDDERVVIAGCDPAALLLARLVEDVSGVRLVPAAAASRAAIRMVCSNRAHLAGSHLEDPGTGEFNVALLRDSAALDGAAVFTMARWEAGLVVAPGNPRQLRRLEDLTRPGVTFINREPGSGSRALLNKLMAKAGVSRSAIGGFDRTAGGHLAAAYRVACGDADACLATRSAARSFGLDFVALQAERYDFVVPGVFQQMPAVRRFLDAIQHASVRRTFGALTSYDTTEMGRRVA